MLQARRTESVVLICVLTVLLWAMACGPAATSQGSKEATADSVSQAKEIVPGVQVLGTKSESASVRGQAVTPTPEPTATLEPAPDSTPTSTPESAPDATLAPAESEEAQSNSVHAELYEVVNTIRANPYVGQFPLEPSPGLEAVAQAYAEADAWNSGGMVNGKRVETLLFEEGVRCRKFWILDTGLRGLGEYPTERPQLMAVAGQYIPDFEAWAADNEDFATHLLWWIDTDAHWKILFLGGRYTHMGYGAAVSEKLSHPDRGNHPGVMIVCEQ